MSAASFQVHRFEPGLKRNLGQSLIRGGFRDPRGFVDVGPTSGVIEDLIDVSLKLNLDPLTCYTRYGR